METIYSPCIGQNYRGSKFWIRIQLQAIFNNTRTDSPSNYGRGYDLDSRGSSGGHPSQSPPQHANSSLLSISDNFSSYGSDVMWPNWPPSLPSPELLRHLYGFTVVLLICDAETLFLGLTSFLCSIHMQIVYSTRRLS